MKHLNKLILVLFAMLATTAVQAQDENNPWAIFIGANAVDMYPTGSNVITPEGRISSENFGEDLFFEIDNWNYVTAFSSLAVTRYIGSGFSAELGGSFNRIDRLGQVDVSQVSWFNTDLTIQYNLKELINSKWFDPYLGVGAGYFWLDGDGGATYNTNLGVNFWISDQFALTLDTMYKGAIDDADNDLFQHRFGFKFSFGGKDTDGDGIYDKYDECPETPGLEEFNGCPDSDGDGIKDGDDRCPDTFGLAEFGGCPDTDGDGIDDTKDECPNEAGKAALNGCPDGDNDGIKDKEDSCPTVAGPKANKGCPWPDTDGDGVLDKDDQCPNVAGTTANNGCPVVTQEVQKTLNEYAKTILFDTGKSSIKDESVGVLRSIVEILREYPNAKFVIEGHTDSVGRAENNQKLSDARANSVKEYLVNNGIDQFRLSSKGYGEDNPIASNKTKAGRAQNRRVEINLVK